MAAGSPFRAVYLPAQHFEYRSKRTLFGLPLVHICLGNGKLCTAKGILAVGNIALGVFALGGISAGLFSIGGISLGLLFSLGGFINGRPYPRRRIGRAVCTGRIRHGAVMR